MQTQSLLGFCDTLEENVGIRREYTEKPLSPRGGVNHQVDDRHRGLHQGLQAFLQISTLPEGQSANSGSAQARFEQHKRLQGKQRVLRGSGHLPDSIGNRGRVPRVQLARGSPGCAGGARAVLLQKRRGQVQRRALQVSPSQHAARARCHAAPTSSAGVGGARHRDGRSPALLASPMGLNHQFHRRHSKTHPSCASSSTRSARPEGADTARQVEDCGAGTRQASQHDGPRQRSSPVFSNARISLHNAVQSD
mmetsp:Transcript_47037/g.125092  ORF Transcript_47037/g.125092 Transcript_47037/m.125092 type:complete len:251 (-) Transcript_47037:431-1183(-)